jgi:restriction endonuclease S subunit
VNQHVCIIRPDERFLPKFISHFMSTDEFQRGIDELQAGATRQALTREQVLNFKLPLLGKNRQQAIIDEIEKTTHSLSALRTRLQEQDDAISALPAAALREAFSG